MVIAPKVCVPPTESVMLTVRVVGGGGDPFPALNDATVNIEL
jgi:hypothetical protein